MLKKIVFVVSFFILLSLVSLGVNRWAYFEVQKRLKVEVSGEYRPAFLLPAFHVRNARFTWQDKVQLIKGDVQVYFDLLSLLSPSGLRIIIESQNSQIRFLGAWAAQQGVEEALIQQLKVDMVIGSKKVKEIRFAEVKSPSFQFSIKDADN